MAVEVTCPDECMGDVIGDLNSRRGKVLGMDSKGNGQVIKALVPMSEILKYAPDLRSMTSGRGSFEQHFSHYDEAPGADRREGNQGDARGARGRRRQIARPRPRIDSREAGQGALVLPRPSVLYNRAQRQSLRWRR